MAKKRQAKATARGNVLRNAARKRGKPAPKRGMRRGPRSQTLPGMEQVRDQRLDNLCEAINDEREQMNQAKVEEGQLIASALKRMHDRNILLYTHGGIELIRVPGSEKLRVRMIKDKGDQSATEHNAVEPAGQEGIDEGPEDVERAEPQYALDDRER